ncbi:hypothetical protein BDY24DRAFT_412843 [Mrakia frigida]|uniref:uncharacterized protein n=1 Tax=Mrakia frigida TaxID=29902 RepID=UPI003FCC0527
MAQYLLSSVAGATSCAMIYYTLSTSLSSRTEAIRSSLHHSSVFLSHPTSSLSNPFPPPPPPPSTIITSPSSSRPAALVPASALPSTRLPHRDLVTTSFAGEVKARWNQDLETAVRGLGRMEWGSEIAKGWRDVKALVESVGK